MVLQSHAGRPARGDHRHCGLIGNKSKPEKQEEEHRKTKRQPQKQGWLTEFKRGCKEAREKHNTLQGTADAEDESSQLAKMMESQTTRQAVPINYSLQRHFLP